MRRLIKGLCVVAILGAAAALGIACAFPGVTYEPSSGEKLSPQTSPLDAGAQEHGETGYVDLPRDDGFLDDGGKSPRVDPATCKDKVPCDCDDDGFAALDCPKDPSTITGSNGPLKPGDCDDLDPRRFPGQTFRDEYLDDMADGDWDCNGVVETSVPTIDCGGTGVTGCTGGQGFAGARPCGMKWHISECRSLPDAQAPCWPAPIGINATQTCK